MDISHGAVTHSEPNTSPHLPTSPNTSFLHFSSAFPVLFCLTLLLFQITSCQVSCLCDWMPRPNVLHLCLRVHLTFVLLAFSSSVYYKAFWPCSGPDYPFFWKKASLPCLSAFSTHSRFAAPNDSVLHFKHNRLPAVGCDSCCLLEQFCLSTKRAIRDKWPSMFLFPNVIFLMRWKRGVLGWHQEPCRHLPQLLPIKPISAQCNFARLRAQTTTVKWWLERRDRAVWNGGGIETL